MATEAKIVLSAVDNTGRAFATAKQSLSGLGSAAENVRTALAGVGTLATVAYLANVVNQARAAVDQFNDLSDATGASVENISALDRVARETGGTFELVSGILIKFNQALKDSDANKRIGAVFKGLSLDIEELKQLDPAEALRRTAVALQGFADDGNKARAVQDLFGESVQKVAPYLKDLAGESALVGTTTTKTAEDIDAFNKEMARLEAQATDLKVALGTNLLAGFNALIDKFREGKREGESFLTTLLKQTEVARLLGLNKTRNPYTETREELERVQKSLASGNLNALQIRAFNEKRAELEARLAGYLNSQAGGGRGFVNPALVRPELVIASDKKDPKNPPKAPKDTPFTGLSYDEQIAQRVGKLFEESDVAKAKEYADTLKKLDDLFFSGAIGPDLYNSAIKGLTGSTGAAADETSIFIQEQQRLADLLDATESAGIEAQRRDMELLAKALAEGTIEEAKYLEAVSARLGLVAEKTKEARSFAEEFGLSFSSAFEDAIAQGKGFSDVLKGVEQDLIRIILRKQVTEPLGDFISSGVGAFFKSFLPSAKGNVFMDAPGLSAYSSSVVNRPTLFPFAKGMGLMGEAGPEAIMPLTRLANGELGVGMRGRAGVTVNIVNQGGAGLRVMSQRERQGADGSMTIDVLVQAVEAGIADNVANRSGPLARGLESGYGLRPSMG